ncbi:MAG: hypothetical protein IT365_19480 [Candidatus Hydrogenedentes bacterium]|nr:hypothetical protein [Candidatus Hydrogenedentota bacterium]
MPPARELLEVQLNDFDPRLRWDALEQLWEQAKRGDFDLPEQGKAVNLHCHSFFSFNGYGQSPACVAWKARCLGLAAAGLVDFDVLDGVDEFFDACRLVGLRTCAGLETRIFLPEFATREINSPGEPGIAYYMGAGFTSSTLASPGLLPRLKETAQQRNQSMLARINPHMRPVELDYEGDVLPLAPKGNATERHLCIAFDRKAKEVFPKAEKRAAFWAEKLGGDPDKIQAMFKEPPVFHAFFRSKVMKAGGVGYVKPEGQEFPEFRTVTKFVKDSGAIPTYAWLDGTSDGEQAMDELLELVTSCGVEAINIIPDRNWNIKDPAVKSRKMAEMETIIDMANSKGLPILVGTEINAYGQRLVDDFAAPEMASLVEPAYEAALIMHGHTALQVRYGMGYVSAWAQSRFCSAKDKMAFYRRVGERIEPSDGNRLGAVGPEMNPEEVLLALKDA